MNERAMILLLEEWHRQLCDGLEQARAAFPDPEPERVRVWKPGMPNYTPPMLIGLEATIDRIGEQIERLRGDADV